MIRCRCDSCGSLVERWIGIVCLPCYEQTIRDDERRECLRIVRDLGEEYGTRYGPDKPKCPDWSVQKIESAIEARGSS